MSTTAPPPAPAARRNTWRKTRRARCYCGPVTLSRKASEGRVAKNSMKKLLPENPPEKVVAGRPEKPRRRSLLCSRVTFLLAVVAERRFGGAKEFSKHHFQKSAAADFVTRPGFQPCEHGFGDDLPKPDRTNLPNELPNDLPKSITQNHTHHKSLCLFDL
jgi:hypothetical protein